MKDFLHDVWCFIWIFLRPTLRGGALVAFICSVVLLFLLGLLYVPTVTVLVTLIFCAYCLGVTMD